MIVTTSVITMGWGSNKVDSLKKNSKCIDKKLTPKNNNVAMTHLPKIPNACLIHKASNTRVRVRLGSCKNCKQTDGRETNSPHVYNIVSMCKKKKESIFFFFFTNPPPNTVLLSSAIFNDVERETIVLHARKRNLWKEKLCENCTP